MAIKTPDCGLNGGPTRASICIARASTRILTGDLMLPKNKLFSGADPLGPARSHDNRLVMHFTDAPAFEAGEGATRCQL
jgi:hypothetical protein